MKPVKTTVKRILSLLLCLCLLVSTGTAALAQQQTTGAEPDENGCYTACKGACGHTPSIILHGIGQSQTFVCDENDQPLVDAKGKTITGWPLYFDTDYAIKQLLFPLLLMLITQHDLGLTSKAEKVVAELVKWNRCDENGKPIYNVKTVKYPYSLARCSQEEKDYIYNNIPLQTYTAAAGEDHLYYFAYNSFGNNIEICDELYAFIEQVKRETGHDKVNLAPISLGGTVANGLLEYHPDVIESLDRVVYIIPALNGSNIIGDLFKNNLSTSGKMVYETMFPLLTEDEVTGNLINVLIRLVPDSVLHRLVDKVISGLMQGVFRNVTNMWALVPSEDYPTCREMWLSGEENAAIRRQTDRYYQAQLHSNANIQKMVDAGVGVFDVVDYSYPLYCFVDSWDKVNADGIIQIESTGMGVSSVPKGQTLPDGYTQKFVNKLGGCNCADPAHHNHITPDREVDGSTAMLPDHTFFFYNADHERTGRNDVVMKLATALMLDHRITDVYSDPAFPQFNVGRDGKSLQNDLINYDRSVDRSAYTPEQLARYDAARDEAQRMLDNTVVNAQEDERVRTAYYDTLCDMGLRSPPEPEKESRVRLGKFLKGLNDLLNKTIGYRSFHK